MKTIENYFSEYGSFHQTSGNKLTHVFGIPILLISVLGLAAKLDFGWVGLPSINLGLLVWVIGNLFYIRLHPKLGLTMVVSTALLFYVGSIFSSSILVGLFVIGWIVQFWGHIQFEKKQPAFVQNLVHLLIGPIFIQNYLLKLVK